MLRRSVLGGMVGAALCVAGCGSNDPEGSRRYPDYRFRLNVEVDTPEGLRTGSSVIEIRTWNSGKNSLFKNTLRREITGEAPVVDLGQRGVMFALLDSGDNQGSPTPYILYTVIKKPTTDELRVPGSAALDNKFLPAHDVEMQRIIALKGLHVIPRYSQDPDELFQAKNAGIPRPSNYPMLVRFRDMSDPKSVQQVDPDNLAKSFGKGVKLRRITVERTDDPVTTGIRERLKWLGEYPEPSLEPIPEPTENPTFAQSISQGDFIKDQ
jgi:hypothetical protein